MNNRCPHCGLYGLVSDRYSGNGKGVYCILCGRRWDAMGRRRVAVEREKKRGCFVPEGKVGVRYS